MKQDPLHLLCVEPRFPGRLGAVADWLVRCRGYRVTFFCHSAEPAFRWPASTGRGLEVIAYNVGGIALQGSVAWTRIFERGLCHAFGAFEVIDNRRIRPVDAILGRTEGLGSSLFAPVSYPKIPIVQFFDYYFHAHQHDLADEAPGDTPVAFFHWRRAANALDLIDLENGVHPWTATEWQRSLYPAEYRNEFMVLHDGIDTRLFHPHKNILRSVAGRTIPDTSKVVTFVARSPDRLRGFDRFVNLVSQLQREDPNLIAIAIGDPEVHHAVDVEHHGRDYAAEYLERNPPTDPDRLWRIGSASPGMVSQVLALSDLHVAPGRAYPVSRSTLEAQATGTTVLATDHAPHRELFTHGDNALLARPEALFDEARRALGDEALRRQIGPAAAASVRSKLSRDVTLPHLANRLQTLAQAHG